MGEGFHFARTNRAICASAALSSLYFLQGLSPISYFILITICVVDSFCGSFPFAVAWKTEKYLYFLGYSTGIQEKEITMFHVCITLYSFLRHFTSQLF
jgi:hypothetical protein